MGYQLRVAKKNGVLYGNIPKPCFTSAIHSLFILYHRLNLILVDVCKNIPYIEQFITLLQKLYNFVSRKTPIFKELQNKYLLVIGNIELKRLCETRCICQIAVCFLCSPI